MDTPPRTWVLADDRTGNVNQAIGVGEALGWPFTVKDIRYRRLAGLPNWLLARSAGGRCCATSSPLAPPWPDLVIAAGRRTAPIARWLKARHPAAFLVQLMWPGSSADLDLIAVPEHDRVPNLQGLIRTIGAPHRITPAGLAAAAAGFAQHHTDLPRPWITCLVGGRRRGFGFEPADAAALARAAGAFARDLGGSLLVTSSRRTGGPCEQALARALDGPHFLYRWSAGGENPYLGMLGSADAALVTADSASMCTEACASGAPVFLYRPGSGGKKLARLHRRLEELGHLLPLGAPWPERVPPPLQPAAMVAEAIRDRLGPAARLPRLAMAGAPASP